MTRDELLQSLQEIGTIEDAAERRSKLTAISDEVNAVYDANENLTSSNSKLEEDKKKLQEYNMELYLRQGSQTKKTEPPKQTEELTYENLFNEKGELK